MNPQFNFDRAVALVGKSIFIDLTVVDHDETFIERKQMFGRIEQVTNDRGISIRLIPSGEEYFLAPDLDSIEPAAPGDYRLETTGEIIDQPDLKTSRLIHLPPPEFENKIVQE
ncbi:MAG: hypothetical protein JWQ98_3708 [Chlorobi bacterium]|nr:hypothetical protein [Chlorobiota bacterium]